LVKRGRSRHSADAAANDSNCLHLKELMALGRISACPGSSSDTS